LNFRQIVDSKDITPETAMIAIGLGLISTPVMLSGYFYFIGVTLGILRKRLKTSEKRRSRANLQDDQIQATLPDRTE